MNLSFCLNYVAAVFTVYSCLLLLVIDTEFVCGYELERKIYRRVADSVYPFCFIVEAHRVFSFLVGQLNCVASFD